MALKPFQKGAQVKAPQTQGRLKPFVPVQRTPQPRPDVRQSQNYLNAVSQAQNYAQEAQKAASFRGMAGDTLKGLISPDTYKKIGNQVIEHPVDTLASVGSGVYKGAVEPLMKIQRYTNPATLIPQVRESQKRMDETLDYTPKTQTGKDIQSGFEFGGAVAPYQIGGEIAGASRLAKNSPRLARYLGWTGTSQALSDKKLTDVKGRGEQLALDTALFGLTGGLRKPKLKLGTEGRVSPEIKQEGRAFSTESKVSEMAMQNKKPTQTKALELSQKLGEDVSFESTIAKEATNVKDKINIIDQLRTPDRVMKKIGMDKEMKLIRKQYDKYIEELPKEINKIDKWATQTTPRENVNIFRYLDGEKVPLTAKEQQIAGEVKTYLKDWADKLDLPEEGRISNYITHIFEKDFKGKEFDEDLAKIITDKVAGSVYDPFTLKRLGAKGYVQDTWRALEAYAKRTTRKVNMDVALSEVKQKSAKLELSQLNYVKKYVDRINLRPTDIDNMIDNTVKSVVGYKFGQRPFATLSKEMRKVIYRGALGLNVSSTLKNLSQGANTYAKLGERYTITGYAKLIKNWNSGELEKVGVLADNFIQDKSLSTARKAMQKFDRVLFSLFETAEKINRGSAYFGAKTKAINQGMSEKEAIEFAKKIVRDTQFTFGSIDTPPVLQSDIGKTLGQFQSFTLKQAEFLTEMVKNKEYAGIIRWMMASLGFVYGIGKSFGMSPKDLIPTLRIGTPPTMQVPVEATKALLGAPNEYGQPTGKREILRAATPLVPAGVQAKKTFQGLDAYNQGYSGTPSDRVRYPIEEGTGNMLRTGIFGQYSPPEARQYFDENRSSLGEKQSQDFRELPREEQQAFYDNIIYERAIKKFDTAIKELLKENKVIEAEEIIKQKKNFISESGREEGKKLNPFYQN